MTSVLGISALYHDAAAALVVDGRIVAAAQEERFSRRKHDAAVPVEAIRYCLGEGGLSAADLDLVAFYDKPLLKFDRLLASWHATAPRGFRAFSLALPRWMREKLHVPRELRGALGGGYRKRFLFAGHHESHAASAFFPSPYGEAAVLTVDGVGEWGTATLGTGRGNRVALLRELRFPHSLGLLYSAFTYHCGFEVNGGEYKLMGLAPYGEPRFLRPLLEEVVELREDGSFRLDLSFFDYVHGLRMTSRRFSERFGGPPRRPGAEVTEREMDLAASVQALAEEILLRMARHLHGLTGDRNLCLAGGVALNCVANGRILREGPFERLWVQPAADDAGGALGAALLAWHQALGAPRSPLPGDAQMGSFLGPRYTDDEVEAFLREQGAAWRRMASEDELCGEAARLLAAGKVLGWFQGRMEFGPRALGARSILADARVPGMQSVLNRKIKFRESFRPFAAAVLADEAQEWFLGPFGDAGPYMLLVAPVLPSRRAAPLPGEEALRGLDRIRASRSSIPAVTHVDGSTRVQTVDGDRHGLFHRLLARFHAETGCPVLVNTSFNVREEPIVRTPQEAWRCFLATGMDALAIGSFLLLREEQPPLVRGEREEYLRRCEEEGP